MHSQPDARDIATASARVRPVVGHARYAKLGPAGNVDWGPDSFTPPSQILDFEMSTFLLWNGLHLFDWMVLFCFFVLHPACVWYVSRSLDSRSTPGCALYTSIFIAMGLPV